MSIVNRLISKILRYFYHKQYFLWVTTRTFFWSRLFQKFGKDSFIFGRVTVFYPENVTLGKNSALDEGVILNARAPIKIGDDVHLSPGVFVTTGSLNLEKAYPHRERDIKPIKIGSGTWIAAQSIILPGVTIGQNCVISANSLVNKDVPKDAVVAGTPAEIVGFIRSGYGKKDKNRSHQ